MKKFVIYKNNKILYSYESEEKEIFGGEWGTLAVQHVEIDQSLPLDFLKIVNNEVVLDEQAQERHQILMSNQEKLNFLAQTDYIVLRHIGQKALNQQTTISEIEYLTLEQQRQDARDAIVEIE